MVDKKQTDGPVWLDVARKHLGTREVKGGKHNPVILKWWAAIRAPFTDDETPWCAAFVGGVLEEAGIRSSRSAAARSYSKFGKELTVPAVGCIVVFWRGSPSGPFGHVGFLVGEDRAGNLMILGGNQADEVNIRAFPRSRVVAYRWPGVWPNPDRFTLPVYKDGKLSTSEA
jgi:uncharacterized protein (TIGR02594 family)